jgi:hypothetical protein
MTRAPLKLQTPKPYTPLTIGYSSSPFSIFYSPFSISGWLPAKLM